MHRLAWVCFAGLVGCGSDDGATDASATEHAHHHEGHGGDLDLSTEKMTDGGSYMVAYSTMPASVVLNEDFTVMVSLTDMDGAPVEPLEVAIDATMPEHGHGMNVMPMVMDMGEGIWHAEGMLFHMEGYWQLEVEVDGEQVTFDMDCCGSMGDAM